MGGSRAEGGSRAAQRGLEEGGRRGEMIMGFYFCERLAYSGSKKVRIATVR